MTIVMLFCPENVIHAGLIYHSDVEHGKMVKKYTVKIDERESVRHVVIIISTFFKVKMS